MFVNSNVTVLEITRPSANIARMIPHKIFIDGQKVGEVRNGKTQTLEVSPGQHEIYVQQSAWVKTEPLTLDCAPNQTIRVRVVQNNPLKQLLMAVTGVGVFLCLEERISVWSLCRNLQSS